MNPIDRRRFLQGLVKSVIVAGAPLPIGFPKEADADIHDWWNDELQPSSMHFLYVRVWPPYNGQSNIRPIGMFQTIDKLMKYAEDQKMTVPANEDEGGPGYKVLHPKFLIHSVHVHPELGTTIE